MGGGGDGTMMSRRNVVRRGSGAKSQSYQAESTVNKWNLRTYLPGRRVILPCPLFMVILFSLLPFSFPLGHFHPVGQGHKSVRDSAVHNKKATRRGRTKRSTTPAPSIETLN